MKQNSTESALLKVHNSIIVSMDNGEVTVLTLLALWAAFDTIDHATLTNKTLRLVSPISQGSNFVFFIFQNKYQSVKIKDTLSDKVTLSYGVPQGSVLGQLFFFILYTALLSAIISSFDLNQSSFKNQSSLCR